MKGRHQPPPTQGAATLLLLPLLMLLSLLAVEIIRTGRSMHEKMRAQAGADLTALSCARFQARALNALAMLNTDLEHTRKLSRSVLAGWTAVAACAAACGVGVGCACAAMLPRVSRMARHLLRRLRDIALALARMQDRIIAAAPFETAAVAADLAARNGLEGLHWRTPEGDSTAAPRLHVRRKGEGGLAPVRSCRTVEEGAALVRGRTVCRSATDLLGGPARLPAPRELAPGFRRLQKIEIRAARRRTGVHAVAHAMVIGNDGGYDAALQRPGWEGSLDAASW